MNKGRRVVPTEEEEEMLYSWRDNDLKLTYLNVSNSTCHRGQSCWVFYIFPPIDA